MRPVRLPRILKKLYPEIIWDIPGQEQRIYLSFDDGPTPGVTAAVLEELARFGAKATFFCIGRNVERHPEIYNQITESGHATGNHTYSHLKGWFTSNREYFDDIQLATRFVPSVMYRPAYGMITPFQLRHLQQHYQIIMWDVMSYDFAAGVSPDKCLNNVLFHARSGSVIVFHDSVKASEKILYALPRVMEHFSERGFSFESIPAHINHLST
jgi:peptidoglycan/xylan/chitin deacetylase (PgdA/CDA1 family)